MSAAQIVRSIQVRSVEQYTYDRNYNRVSFQISPDGLSTDLSQSYLKLTLSLTDIGTIAAPTEPVLLTQADFNALIAKHLVVSFGHDGTSYSPACLISLARLRAKGSGEILEEIQFANVLSQTLFQLCNNFETLGASNLLTGSATQLLGHASSLMENLSAFLQPNTEIQINLRDIFGIARHTNFDLSKTGGLIMEFELEQTHNLFQLQTAYNPRAIDQSIVDATNTLQVLPEYASTSLTLYSQTPESMGTTCLTTGQIPIQSNKRPAFNDLLIEPVMNMGGLVQVPRDGFKFDGKMFEPVQAVYATQNLVYLVFKTNANGGIQFTAPQMTACKLVAGNQILITQTMTEVATGTQKPFQSIHTINAVTTGVGSSINFSPELVFEAADFTDYTITLSTVEVLEIQANGITGQNPGYMAPMDVYKYIYESGQPGDQPLGSHTLALNESQMEQLVVLGIVDASLNGVYAPSLNSFDLGIQGESNNDENVYVTYDRVVNDATNSRRVYSNQFTRLCVEGKRPYISSISGLVGGFYTLTFGNFFLNSSSGFQAGTNVLPTAGANNTDMKLYTLTGGTPSYGFWFLNVQQPVATGMPQTRFSYSISQFQVVLVQETMTMPMTPAYSSWSVEVAMIETDQQQYSRQWILTAPNLYNGFFMTPDYLVGAGGSLVSTARGIANYRISVNNVSNTNRVVPVQDVVSQSPSSLHFDKMMTAFNNSEYNLRSLTGIQTVSDSRDPTVVIPIKIYSGVVGGQYQMGPATLGATIQLDLYGSPKSQQDNVIAQGPIFLFKQMIRNIAVGMGSV